jgi:hypothetical protein
MIETLKPSRRRVVIAALASVLLVLSVLFAHPQSAVGFGPVTIWSATSTLSGSYARALELEHSGANNGKLYATFETWSSTTMGPTFPIYESVNGGTSWSQVGTVSDTGGGGGLREQGQLFELPQAIGSMPAGTMLLAVNAFPHPPENVHYLELYKSNDLGRTWTYVSRMAAGGAYACACPASDGIWEPFLAVAENRLFVWYADEQDAGHNQRIMHRSSTDGVTWSSAVEDIALADSNLRPGMPVVTLMGSGEYLLMYEIVNMNDNRLHYKMSTDPDSFGSVTDPGVAINYYKGEIPGAQPYVVWMPAGGPNGTLVASGGGSDKLFVNYNFGRGEWRTVNSVIPMGYSRSLVHLSGSDVLVIGNVPNGSGKSDIKVGTVTIPDSSNEFSNKTTLLINRNGKGVDLIGGSTADGATVNQWTVAPTSWNQHWSIVPAGGDRFRLASKVSGKQLAPQAGSSAAGTQLVASSYSASTAQQWKFVDVGDGWSKIENAASGLVIEVAGGSTADNAKLQTATYSGSNSQKWRIQPVGDTFIQASHSGKYINVGGGNSANGTAIGQYSYETNSWFKWQFQSTTEGWYRVNTGLVAGKVADVSAASTTPGAGVVLWSWGGWDNQQVRLTPTQSGGFQLTLKHSSHVWDVIGSQTTNNAILTQYTNGSTPNQVFHLEN